MMSVSAQQALELIYSGYDLIDVRAPIEFAQGSIPGSFNYAILNDDERAVVGTCYKKQGRERAIELGYHIVSGENKESKLNKWKTHIKKCPKTILTCFRGGLRSQISQKFLREAGIEISRVEGGYKAIRQEFNKILEMQSDLKMTILTGPTGSGKSQFLQKYGGDFAALDLERFAHHRGSAFGKLHVPQPSQSTFENRIAFDLYKFQKSNRRTLLVEDESRVIGSLHIPENVFNIMRAAPVIMVETSLEDRIKNIFAEYITEALAHRSAEELKTSYLASLQKISKKLGDQRKREIDELIVKAFADAPQLTLHGAWIERLLIWYYDPLYSSSLRRRNVDIKFRGTEVFICDYLKATL